MHVLSPHIFSSLFSLKVLILLFSLTYLNSSSFFFFLKEKLFLNLFIYLFIFAVLGLRFCARAFSSCGERGPLLIAVRGPLTVAASLVAEHRLQTRRLTSCGSRAQLLRSMWDLPRPGLEPVSPALAGRFSTTAPPGKPSSSFFFPGKKWHAAGMCITASPRLWPGQPLPFSHGPNASSFSIPPALPARQRRCTTCSFFVIPGTWGSMPQRPKDGFAA